MDGTRRLPRRFAPRNDMKLEGLHKPNVGTGVLDGPSAKRKKPPLCKGRWAKSPILLGGVVMFLLLTIPQSEIKDF